MSDLISRSALTRWLEMQKSNAHPLDYSTKATYAGCIAMVSAMEPVDAVPVVRCRECVFRGSDHCPMCHDEYSYDEDDGGDYYTVDNTTDDGFCDQGEREVAEDDA